MDKFQKILELNSVIFDILFYIMYRFKYDRYVPKICCTK